MPKRTLLYLRYSSINQARRGGVSLADQLRTLRRVAEDNGEEVVAELVDQARTGTETRRREAFQEMMRHAREHAMDLVRAESIDRATRNELDRRVMEQELSKYGIELLYVGEDADLPPEQLVLNRGIRGTVAEFESLQISQRVYSRMKFRAEQGKWRGGPVNYGLQPDGDGWLEPDPETYPYLLHILRRLSEGWGPFRVCKELNKGISIDGGPPVVPPTPSTLLYRARPYVERMDKETGDVLRVPKPEPSPYWAASSVRALLREATDGIYTGTYTWGREANKLKRDKEGRPKQLVTFQHEPLIPQELIDKLRSIRERPEQKKKGRPSTYILHPTCAICGGPMPGSSYKYKDRIKRYYVCSRGKSSGNRRCTTWTANAEFVETCVLDYVTEHLAALDATTLKRQLDALAAETVDRLEARIADADRRVQEGQKLKDDNLRYLVTYGSGIEVEVRRELERQIAEAVRELETRQQERADLEEGLRILKERPKTIDLSAIEETRELLSNREHAGHEPLRRALALLVREVRLTPAPLQQRKSQNRTVPVTVEVELRDITDAFGKT